MSQRILIVGTMLMVPLSILAAPPEARAVLDMHKLPLQGETLVWSPLFQASWEKMQSLHAGKMEKVVPANPVINALEKFQWKEQNVMPKDGYAVYAGPATPEFAKATAEEIKKKFGIDMTPSRIPSSEHGNAFYGILLRDLNFQKSFFRSRKKPLEFKDGLGKTHKVQFFGTIGKHSDDFGNNVKVLDYNDQGKSFILSIATDQQDEKLIIYRPGRALSFQMAIDHLNKPEIKAPLGGAYGSLSDGTLHKKDTVKIPYLTIKADTDLTSQVAGARHYVQDPMPWRTTIAYQITHFELFEKGARIRVETGSDDGPFGGPPPPRRVTYVPRQFICDHPFFVFAWRDGASHPYFAAWIDGNAALQLFTK